MLTNTLAGPSASEVTTLWRYTNLFSIIIFIIIIIITLYLGGGFNGRSAMQQIVDDVCVTEMTGRVQSSVAGL